MSYGVDALRGVLTSVTHFGLSFDLIVLSIIAAVLVFIGGALFETIQL
jgi:hypothetical protein